MPPTAAPAPIPAFAPVLSPVESSAVEAPEFVPVELAAGPVVALVGLEPAVPVLAPVVVLVLLPDVGRVVEDVVVEEGCERRD